MDIYEYWTNLRKTYIQSFKRNHGNATHKFYNYLFFLDQHIHGVERRPITQRQHRIRNIYFNEGLEHLQQELDAEIIRNRNWLQDFENNNI